MTAHFSHMTAHFTDLVFLHGGHQGSWVWDETIAALEHQLEHRPRIHTLDVIGCGKKRGATTDGLNMNDVVEDLVADLDNLDLGRTLIVGHSQAGLVIPFLLARRSQNLARVLYVACAAPPPQRSLVDLMGTGISGTHPDTVGYPLDPATTPPRELFAAMFCNDMSAAEADHFLAQLGKDAWPSAVRTEHAAWPYDAAHAVPSTYVVTLQDAVLGRRWQKEFAQRFGADTIRIDAGHQVMQTRPYALAEIVKQHLIDEGTCITSNAETR